ncbi:MAG: hypothetical protein AAB920_03065, partial [Patescibacteria group bacterium]
MNLPLHTNIKVAVLLFAIVGVGVVIFYTLRKSTPPLLPKEGLSTEDVQRIDVAPESSLPEHQVILPNGQSLDDYAKSRGISAGI